MSIKLPEDFETQIQKQTTATFSALQNTALDETFQAKVLNYPAKARGDLKAISAEMIHLLRNDFGEGLSWTVRVESCNRCIDSIESLLGRRVQFGCDWLVILEFMSIIEATFQVTRNFLHAHSLDV